MKIVFQQSDSKPNVRGWKDFKPGELFYCAKWPKSVFVRLDDGVLNFTGNTGETIVPIVYSLFQMSTLIADCTCLPTKGKVTMIFGEEE